MKTKQLAVLKVLKEAGKPLSSPKIAKQVVASGHNVRERTVRLYLSQMDTQGLTENLGRRGRLITESGLRELASSRSVEEIGVLSARIDQMACSMDFNLVTRRGTVVVNVSLFSPADLVESVSLITRVFKEGFAMGRLMALLPPGERIGEMTIPDDMVGVGTVCSITINGVLLRYGIPTVSRFAGLLKIRGKKPSRFVEMITYDASSLDPLEVFVGSGMTDHIGATTSGDGLIGASFREFPAVSRNLVIEFARRLEEVGLGGLSQIGWPSQSLLDIPVHEGRVGAVVFGGLNPLAVMVERGKRLHSKTLAGLLSYNRLFPYQELDQRIGEVA